LYTKTGAGTGQSRGH